MVFMNDPTNPSGFQGCKTKVWWRFWLVLTGLLVLVFTNAPAKEYQISKLAVTIHLKQDGSMAITEERTYQFQGSFRYVYRSFPADGQYTFSDIGITEGEQRYPLSNKEESGTMHLDTQDQTVKAWAFFQAKDTTRTFRFNFLADEAIERYQDAATLDYPVISEAWDKPTNNITIRVIPPEPVLKTAVNQWVNGSLKARSKVTEKGVIQVKLGHLPADETLRIRALYHPGLFPGLPQKAKGIKTAFRRQSNELIEDARQARQRKQMILWSAIPYALILTAFWVWLFRAYRQKPEPERPPKNSSDPPSSHSPAAINYLMGDGLSQEQVFSATLLSLANKGFIQLGITEEKDFLGFSDEKALFQLNRQQWEEYGHTLQPYEHKLMAFAFEKLADDKDQFSTKTLEDQQGTVENFLQDWIKEIQEVVQKHAWFDTTSRRGRDIGIFVSVALFVLHLTMAALYNGWMLLLAGITVPFFAASFFIVHRTKRGLTLYKDWEAFKQFLKDRQYLSNEAQPSKTTFYQYLIYGLVLGLSRDDLKTLGNDFDTLFPDTEPHFFMGIEQTQEAIGHMMQTVIASTAIAATTASGGGAGGGAGGSGGGGAG